MLINKVPCPECGAEIDLVEKPGDPKTLQGFCNCKGRKRAVYQTHVDLIRKSAFILPANKKNKGGFNA